MKTKIYYDRDLIGRFTCDGKRYTKLQRMTYHIKKFVKRGMIGMFFLSLIGWSLYAGANLMPITVFADKEVIKPTRFEDIPMLVKICKAESGLNQFKKNGDVVRGKVNPSDIGICQINEYINNDEARRLGYDIYTEQGNKDYAVYLYMNRGTAPWNSSKSIWNTTK